MREKQQGGLCQYSAQNNKIKGKLPRDIWYARKATGRAVPVFSAKQQNKGANAARGHVACGGKAAGRVVPVF
jgi:hypothetical protein